MKDTIALDTETGGLCPSVHALLSIGAACSWSNETFLVYLQPARGRLVEPAAAAVNGYAEGLWEERGAVDLETGWGRWLQWLGQRLEERPGAVVLAHNAAFDRGFLEEAGRLSGMGMGWHRHSWRCSQMLLATLIDAGVIERGSAGLERLGKLCGFWSKDRPPVHAAREDAQAALAGWRWLMERLAFAVSPRDVAGTAVTDGKEGPGHA